jgi:serine/threonine protein kinase
MKYALKAVEYMHANNVVHRDISLANIIYEKKKRVIKVLDFSESVRCFQNTKLE